MRRLLLAYSVVELLFWLGYSIYFTFTRMYIENVMGQAYGFIALLIAAEEAPLLASLVFGGLADIYGRRKMMLLGLGESLAVASMGFTGIGLLPMLAAVAALFYAIGYTAFTGVLLAATRGSAKSFSMVTLWGSVGWALGGPLAGILYSHGPAVEFTASALAIAFAYLLAYMYTPPQLEKTGAIGFHDVVKAAYKLTPLMVFTAITSAGLVAFFGPFSLKLSAEIDDPILFGIVYSTLPALLGAAVRPLAGVACDTLGSLTVAVATTLAYIVLNYGLTVMHGLPAILLWLIPLYPFRDVSIYTLASQLLPSSLQATAGSAVNLAISVSGLLVGILAPLLEDMSLVQVYTVSTVIVLVGLVALAPYARRGSAPVHRPVNPQA